MKIKIKQKFYSFTHTYEFLDENNNIIYIMKDFSNFGSEVYNNENQLILKIKKVKNMIIDDFYFIQNDKKIAELLEETTLTVPTYSFPIKNWKVLLNFCGETKYKVVDENNEIIMTSNKNLFHITKNYDIEIKKEEDLIYCIMIACALCSRKIRSRRLFYESRY